MVCYALIKMNGPVPPAQIWKDLAVHHSRLGSILEDVLLVPLPNVAVREVLLGLKPVHWELSLGNLHLTKAGC